MKPVVDLKTQDHRRLSLRKTVANLGFEKSFTGGQGPLRGRLRKGFHGTFAKDVGGQGDNLGLSDVRGMTQNCLIIFQKD